MFQRRQQQRARVVYLELPGKESTLVCKNLRGCYIQIRKYEYLVLEIHMLFLNTTGWNACIGRLTWIVTQDPCQVDANGTDTFGVLQNKILFFNLDL